MSLRLRGGSIYQTFGGLSICCTLLIQESQAAGIVYGYGGLLVSAARSRNVYNTRYELLHLPMYPYIHTRGVLWNIDNLINLHNLRLDVIHNQPETPTPLPSSTSAASLIHQADGTALHLFDQ